MCPEYYRRGRNWYTAMGALFIVSACIVLIRQLVLWTPDFMVDFLLNSEITHEKISVGMIGFGLVLVARGFKNDTQR